MTRKFNVIKVDDYGVVVGNTKPKDHEPCYDLEKKIFIAKCERGYGRLYLRTIVATIHKRIEGLPLIELPDEEYEIPNSVSISSRAEKEFNYGTLSYMTPTGENDAFVKGYNIGHLEGYKAAQSKGVYSEEDMRVAIRMARENNYQQDHYNMRTYSSEKYTSDQILNSLQKNKLPVAVLLDMETYNPPEEQYLGVHKHLRVKLTDPETNTIKPINVFL